MQSIFTNNYSTLNISHVSNGTNSLYKNMPIQVRNVNLNNATDNIVYDASSKPLQNTGATYAIVHVDVKVEKSDLSTHYMYLFKDSGVKVSDIKTYIPCDIHSKVDYLNFWYVAPLTGISRFMLQLLRIRNDGSYTYPKKKLTGTVTWYCVY